MIQEGPAPAIRLAGTEGNGETSASPSVSVIVPVTGETHPLDRLYRDHAKALRQAGRTFEFVAVVEPHQARAAAPLLDLREEGEPIRVLRVGQSVGEATLTRLGLDHVSAPIVVLLPGYRRVKASVIPHLVDLVEAGGDVASARRWPRRDSWINRLQSRTFNALVSGLAGGRVQDVASGVVAVRRSVLEELPLYGDFFRFLPLLAYRDGYRVQEVAAEQHPDDTRTRVRGPSVYARRLLDILGLFFLLRFTEKPLRFFGLLGTVTSLAGATILLVMLIQRFQGQAMADRPLLLLGALLVVLGVQAIALGLVGEIIVHLHAAEGRASRARSQGDTPAGAPTYGAPSSASVSTGDEAEADPQASPAGS